MTETNDRRPPRVRFAPSPTGFLHIGGARTALFNWLYARGRGGTFVLRLEDTDTARNTPQARQAIFDGLRWLGLTPDEGPEKGGPYGPYAQSERGAIYREAVERLRDCAAIYPCFCTKERLEAVRAEKAESGGTRGYDRRCRALPHEEACARAAAGEPHTWRLAVPPGETTYEDGILGPVTVSHESIEDLVLVRTDGTPVYNFAVVIDDHRMAITEVIRGQDHQMNTIKQILIYRALGWDAPRFAHVPLILAPPPHKGKLSKRHGGAELHAYAEKGYPPEAFINWLALIGWSFDDKTEIMTREELIERFSLERVGKTGAQLNLEKLDWIAGDWIRRAPIERVEEGIRPFLERAGWLDRIRGSAARRIILRTAQERIRWFGEVIPLYEWAFAERLAYDEKARAMLRKRPGTRERLARYREALPAGPFDDPKPLEEHARGFAQALPCKFGDLVHPIRAAITGRVESPPIFDCFVVVGRDEVVRRLEAAEAFIAAPEA
ncbi:MAG: glutamate--tRNA ligase [Planctomycetes bacterium]|nr:glutamate--tRNA ligase [Planctomycetota bacterium]